MAKIRNAEREFFFDLATPDESTSNGVAYVDLNQCWNLVNRVSKRQGEEIAITNIEIGCQAGGAFTATIYKLPSHWPCINAWEKAMRHWKAQQDDAAREAGLESTKAAYRDFKIHFDSDHTAAGFANNLLPSGYNINDVNSKYEWEASQIVIPNDITVGNTTETLLHMVGPDVEAAGVRVSSGLIQAYAESRSRPIETDPNIVQVPFGGLYGEMEDVGDNLSDVITNMQDHNHQPPYEIGENGVAEEFYPGGSIQGIGPIDSGGAPIAGQFFDILSINAGANFNSDSTGGTTVPCGLLKIAFSGTGVQTPAPPAIFAPPTAFWMKITVAAGPARGSMARSMVVAN